MRKALDDATLEILRDGTEKQLAKLDMPWPDNEEELGKIINAVVNRQHDYGTCVYAMSIAAEAAFNFAARRLGVTGFQASCADMDIIRRIRHWKDGFALVNYENLLYPQYRERFDEVSWDRLLESQKESLRKRAAEKLSETDNVHPNVKTHWERLLNA